MRAWLKRWKNRLLAGGAVLLLPGGLLLGLVWYFWGRSSAAKSASADGSEAVAAIYYRDRADGVDQRLQDFLDYWIAHGPWDASITSDGGVRTDEAHQEALYAAGKTKAKTLGDTPHGRGGAIDLAPHTVLPVSDDDSRWDDIGAQVDAFNAATGNALKWGGNFTSIKDKPHVEVPDWKTLSMPTADAVA